jgi:tetratricopeptide (TPR) repeat protein
MAATPAEKAEMLMEIAIGAANPAQDGGTTRACGAVVPARARDLSGRLAPAAGAHHRAIGHGAAGAARWRRRIPARGARCYETALLTLKSSGKPEEVAELEMNLGLVQQALAPSGAARLHDAIQCYHRALRTFTREAYPQEFSILHNNLAIAYLSIPLADERGKMREALAVQSFEEVLKVINLVDHPGEYAMIQNNLGNALQYAASGHSLENNLRALDAYDEALKVRNPRDTPFEYANTLSNKANVLRNLPDDPDAPDAGAAPLEQGADSVPRGAAHVRGAQRSGARRRWSRRRSAEIERELMGGPHTNGAGNGMGTAATATVAVPLITCVSVVNHARPANHCSSGR